MSYLRKLELRQKVTFEAFLKPPPARKSKKGKKAKEEQEGKRGWYVTGTTQGRSKKGKNSLVQEWYRHPLSSSHYVTGRQRRLLYHWYNAKKKQEGKK